MDGMIDLKTTRMIARIEGGVGWMVFNNPDRRNAVSLEMWEAIPVILDRFASDPAVRVIALTGAGGKAFVSGADISEFERVRSTPEQVAHYETVAHAAHEAIMAAAKPTVAVIRGFCIGGGLAIAINCDLRFATEASTFAVPAGKLGLGYGPSGVRVLMDLVGPAFTKEIFYTARQFSAAEALVMGLVNRVVPDAALEGYATAQCETIAGNAPLTLRALKQTVTELLRGPEGDIDLCDRMVAECFASEDYKEGRRAFMEKRKPAFAGR